MAHSGHRKLHCTLERTIDLASNAKQLPIGQRNCPNNYDGMAAFPFFGGVSLQPFVEVR